MKTAFIAFYFFLLFYIAVYGLHLYWIIAVYYRNRHRRPGRLDGVVGRTEFPVVTVQLPIFNESRVAVRLIEAVRKFDWPTDKLEIQILDDSTDVTSDLIAKHLNQLCQAADNICHLRRGNRHGFKAGALAWGLTRCEGEFIAVFDADNLPRSDFLKRTIPYFNDPEVGMVQTRWSFLNRSESFLCRAQALFLDAHFHIEQQARYFGNLLFNFNGTAGVWRRKTIVEADGWQFDTLTEDLDLSIRAQLKGWKFIYDDDCHVPTELPNSVNGFKTQQYRWTKGAIQTAFKLLPSIFRSELTRRAKISAFFHLTSKSISLALLMLALLLVPALYIRLEAGLPKLLLIDLPVFLVGTGSMSLFYGLANRASHRKKSWSDSLIFPMLTSLGIALAVNNSRALLSALFRRKSGFVRTPKSGSTDRHHQVIPRAYLGRHDFTTVVESALALYSMAAVIIAWQMSLFFTVPFLSTFFLGYSYFSLRGLRDIYAQ